MARHQKSSAENAARGGEDENKEKQGKKVEVTVDTKQRKVEPDEYVVAVFKQEVKVDAALALDQFIDGALTPLDDTATVVIKGGEVFVSHVRQGGAS